MILFKTVREIQQFLHHTKKPGQTVGFVPTMGALHEGHISLIEEAKKTNTVVICSIFVNPAQFNDPKDYKNYPVTIERDINMLEKAGCTILFLPSVLEIYPNEAIHQTKYELGFIETVLDGKYRPGHFQGVCRVVDRLLTILTPHNMFLGQKDYQQCMVLKKMVELTGSKTVLNICPTQREKDGLAMSSRNMRLTENERIQATKISETLTYIKREIKPGYLGDLKERCVHYLTAEGFKVDYVEIANAQTLELLDNWNGETKTVALIAAFLNEVRLIDNMLMEP